MFNGKTHEINGHFPVRKLLGITRGYELVRITHPQWGEKMGSNGDTIWNILVVGMMV